MEKVIKVQCSHCRHPQTTIVRTDVVYGKRRTCVYCGKGFTLNKYNVLLNSG